MVGNRPSEILAQAKKILVGKSGPAQIPEKWDGHAAQRIVDHILEAFIS
jgi:UDP-N-acetylglucosamine 2-epimerase (non-hydrolysing)